MYKTNCGIDMINQRLQVIFNPKDKSKKELVVGDVIFREGDKVIELTNMPEEKYFIMVILVLLVRLLLNSEKNYD